MPESCPAGFVGPRGPRFSCADDETLDGVTRDDLSARGWRPGGFVWVREDDNAVVLLQRWRKHELVPVRLD